MPNMIYEGRVRVDDKKADGSKLIIGKGDRQGEPYYKVSFKEGEAWVNLMDFDGVTGGQGGDYRIEYYQKFAPNGEPELFNGKPQYQMVDIAPLGGAAPATQSANAATPAAPRDDSRQESIQRQTAAKCAAEVVAGLDIKLVTDMVSTFDIMFDHILARIEGKAAGNEFDAMIDSAKGKLGADDDPDSDVPF